MTHSVYLAFPFAVIHFLWTDKKAFSYKLKTFPFLLFSINYCFVMIGLFAFNSTSTLIFDDYCKRGSYIYDTDRTSQALKTAINKINKEHSRDKEA